MCHKEWKIGTMVERIQPVGPPNLLNNMVKVFANTGNTLPPSNPLAAGSGADELRFRGSPTKGTKSELAASTLPSRGPKRGQKCYVTPAFSGAEKRAEMLRNPCILGGPQQRGRNQKWLPHPCLLGGPKKGGSAT